ncbi:hypothetical protein THII_3370 [Thioploca ingrica]|uniref:SWIM-type domain-containing protein n=1 Tax=Thioploca ingrica TaxID=40754 RepID=A0A090ANH7_9GAMM|nr:hypothetical protein THII_3370 [Thioploca ingrica]
MIPKLTSKDIQKWTDEKYFQRGHSYFQGDAIYEQRRLGMTIKSKCSGTQAPFYRQEVTFNEKGIQSAKCSCPVGAGGRCKHVVALLLTWVEDSESFQEIENLEATLEKRSREELIALIRRLIDANPDLEDLINLPVVSKDKNAPLDLKAIRRQASHAMKHVSRGGWDDEGADLQEVVKAFQPLIALADDYVARNDPANAASIYMIVCEEIIEDEELLNFDEEGDLGGIVSAGVDSLGKCLSALSDPNIRRKIFDQLFSIYKLDILDLGGIGLADEVPELLIHQTSPAEKEEIAKWIEAVMLKGSEWSSKFKRDCLGQILLELKKANLDDEGYLALCRKTEQIHNLVDHLLKLNRVDEAVMESHATSDYDLLKLAEFFIQHKYDSHAEELISARAKMGQDKRLLEWLMAHAEKKKDYNAALSLAEQLFWQHPSLQSFEEVSKHSQKILKWDETRTGILSKLEEKKEYILLSKIYLKEENIESAISAWERSKSNHFVGESLQLTLAQAAEKTLPHEAIRLYLQMVESAISRKNRPAYIEAITLLKKVKSLYEKLGEETAWKALFGDLRAKYPTLRALQEELRKAKL